MNDQNKVAFLEGRLSSSQSVQSEKFSKSPNWLEKGQPFKKATFVVIMTFSSLYDDHFNRGPAFYQGFFTASLFSI